MIGRHIYYSLLTGGGVEMDENAVILEMQLQISNQSICVNLANSLDSQIRLSWGPCNMGSMNNQFQVEAWTPEGKTGEIYLLERTLFYSITGCMEWEVRLYIRTATAITLRSPPLHTSSHPHTYFMAI